MNFHEQFVNNMKWFMILLDIFYEHEHIKFMNSKVHENAGLFMKMPIAFINI